MKNNDIEIFNIFNLVYDICKEYAKVNIEVKPQQAKQVKDKSIQQGQANGI